MFRWFRRLILGRELTAARTLLEAADARASAMENRRAELESRLEIAEDDFEETAGRLRAELADARTLLRQYEKELEHCRAQLHVAEETTIPALVQAHQLVQERARADTAFELRRQVAHGAGQEERE